MPKFERHVFICGNEREADHPRGCCLSKGSAAVRDAFKVELSRHSLKSKVRANHAGCLDQCEHGVTLVVYPDAIWYGNVDADDVAEIVESHLVNGRPVARLLITDDCLNNPRCPHRQPAK